MHILSYTYTYKIYIIYLYLKFYLITFFSQISQKIKSNNDIILNLENKIKCQIDTVKSIQIGK